MRWAQVSSTRPRRVLPGACPHAASGPTAVCFVDTPGNAAGHYTLATGGADKVAPTHSPPRSNSPSAVVNARSPASPLPPRSNSAFVFACPPTRLLTALTAAKMVVLWKYLTAKAGAAGAGGASSSATRLHSEHTARVCTVGDGGPAGDYSPTLLCLRAAAARSPQLPPCIKPSADGSSGWRSRGRGGGVLGRGRSKALRVRPAGAAHAHSRVCSHVHTAWRSHSNS